MKSDEEGVERDSQGVYVIGFHADMYNYETRTYFIGRV